MTSPCVPQHQPSPGSEEARSRGPTVDNSGSEFVNIFQRLYFGCPPSPGSGRQVRRGAQKLDPKTVHDKSGQIFGDDLCDCLMPDCPGCHSSCERCGSRKCGCECRCGRPWTFVEVSIEGKDMPTFRNPYATKQTVYAAQTPQVHPLPTIHCSALVYILFAKKQKNHHAQDLPQFDL